MKGVVALAAVLLLGGGVVSGVAAGDVEVVASVGDRAISRTDLDRRLTVARTQLEQQWHAHSLKVLNEMVMESLLEQEAAGRSITVPELLRQEVDAKTRVITDAEITEFIQLNQGRIRAGTPDVSARVRQQLEKQARDARQQQYYGSVRAAARVELRLPEPAIAPVKVGTAGDRAMGPSDAPVTIVEFSDFQCPYCQSVQATLKRIRERFGDRVRLVFRDLPIVDLHPGADRAAEAGRCAAEQGKFWEYHDVLFAAPDKQKPEDLVRYGKDLGLSMSRFEDCLTNRRFAAAVAADVAEAKSLGLGSTPAFFINGRVLLGAHPYENFEKLIDGELKRLGR
jgi:protein-disulfide isomerase